MTEQECIEWMDYLRNMKLAYDRSPNKRKTACNMAIKALEKQIPKQVKLYIGQDMQCPECNKRLRAYEGMKICYCKFCGQALER